MTQFYQPRILLSAIALGALPLRAAPPVFPAHPDNTDVPTTIPTGKTLVLPVAADDPDGDPISYKVSVSHPRIFARVRSGNMHYKVHVHTDDDGSVVATPTPFDGDLEFQLFRNATPETAAFIAGFAQSGYFDNVLFHRVIPNFVIQGGDPAGTGSGPAPYNLRHEFRPELIHSGRGQLAMANSEGGYRHTVFLPNDANEIYPDNGNQFDYRTASFQPTNGSQFFVTLGQPRHLDFKHTVFGQLVRGFDTLNKVAGVPRGATDKPTVAVKMTTHSVTASRTDAVLLLSAIDTVPAAIVTITATDANGETATKAIIVKAEADTVNNSPILEPFDPVVMPVGGLPGFSVRSLDLEHDAISTRFPVREGQFGEDQYASLSARNLFSTSRPTPGPWDLTIGVSALNDPLTNVDPFSASRFEVLEIGVGDKAVVAEPKTLEATAGQATGSVVLATFRHGAAATRASDYSATVNWGDGSALQTTSGANPPVTVVRSATLPATWEVKADHTYARTGVYPLHVIVDGPSGATGVARGTAVVNPAGATLRAIGQDLEFRGALFGGRPIAYFTDSTPGTKVGDYSVLVDWGDGQREPGVVRQVGPGRFAVVGSHRYLDAETFSLAVQIRRNSPVAEAVAWSTLKLRGFAGPVHLPPFAKANITAVWSEEPIKVYRTPNATDLEATLFILNGGSKDTGKWKLRFWLSNDPTLSPQDTQLKFGSLKRLQSELKLNSLPSGGGGNLSLKRTSGSDFTIRLPFGETGAGRYLITELVYSDPLTDKMPVAKTISFGRLPGTLVSKASMTIKEGSLNNPLEKDTFRIRLDTLPTSIVNIALAIVDAAGNPVTTRATISPAQLQFTTLDATTDQTVTVTAVDDLLKNSSDRYFVQIKPATSIDARFQGLDAPDISLRILDNLPTINVTPGAVTVTEAEGAGRTATFKIKLSALPTAAVTVPLEIVNTSNEADPSRATLDVVQLVISDTAEHTVTVTAVDDALVNGTGNFTIRVKAATSLDTRYNNQDPSDVALSVTDNE